MHRLSAYVIVHRTQSNQTPNANQSDSGRNTIRQRTESPGGAAVSAAPTKPTEQSIQAVSARLCRLPEQELHQQNKQSYQPGGAAVSAAPTKQTELSFHEPQPDPRPARYHAPRSHEQPIAPIDGHYLLAALHRTHDVRRHMLR